jgi:hypothetical protein
MVRPKGTPLCLPGAAKPLRAASGQIAFGYLEKLEARKRAADLRLAVPDELDTKIACARGLKQYLFQPALHRLPAADWPSRAIDETFRDIWLGYADQSPWLRHLRIRRPSADRHPHDSS